MSDVQAPAAAPAFQAPPLLRTSLPFGLRDMQATCSEAVRTKWAALQDAIDQHTSERSEPSGNS